MAWWKVKESKGLQALEGEGGRGTETIDEGVLFGVQGKPEL